MCYPHRASVMKRDVEKKQAAASRQGIQVIARAAAILRALEGEEAGLSLAQIAQKVDLARSTVQRIVEALSAEQLLIAAGPQGRVRLGPALTRIAASAKLEVARIVRPVLVELSRELGETVDLSVLKGGAAVFIDQLPGSHRLRAVSAVGEAFPLHCTASGKALLSLVDERRLDALVPSTLPKLTASTLTKGDAVRTELDLCRRRLYALDMEEHTEGICAVGIAFVDPESRLYAVSIPVPATRFKRRRSELVTKLLAAREAISALLPAP